ncbi:hypothetical protein AALO_G00142490 [Alosa alosa]|uniref:Cysteine-rich with EGF-like domain protein 1 n=1 Tax=Alosa alosa TaxID=278164 RepID=A0AAV6GNP8_9TELE|nr:protein disulfide isomerase Creld1 [Alosa alosa]KAG5275002.1 hypothetical protein AALO_G00142490 [Alosa alosa]
MLPLWKSTLSAILCLSLPWLVLLQQCSDSCRACGGPDNHTCLACKDGWSLHDRHCVDVDECDTKLTGCPSNTYCFNTEGSFECRGCDPACAACMGSGPARCKKCANGYTMTGAKCVDVDECSENELMCPGLDEFCMNKEGSFYCQCAKGFRREDGVCKAIQTSAAHEKGLFDDIQEEEIEVLQQMFFGVILCALGTLAAKGDMVFTSIFMGAVAAMAGFWFSDRGDQLLDSMLRGR